MYKLLGILKRPQGMDFDEFKTWWLETHAPKVKKWPGLVEYRINLCTTDDQPFDGVAEVWFSSKQAMDDVFSTPEGQTARGSATGGSSDLAILLTEEHIMVEP
ncbi:MAG: EthD family reductase [Pseudomonadota bacterium]